MRALLVIGIGAGDPDHLTLQAVKALQTVDVFFVVDKGAATQELVALRAEILRRHVPAGSHRVVEVADPDRDRAPAAYGDAIADWRRRRADSFQRLVRDELTDGQAGAFLVWGDPTLFDSTLGVLDDVAARGGPAFTVEVIPGISSVAALCARHRVPLNRVGRPVQLTTGRRLAQGWPDGVDDLVVLLDTPGAFADLPDRDAVIHWGAYVGMPDELLVSGALHEVAEEIAALRTAARARKGWIMDTYVLRRDPPA